MEDIRKLQKALSKNYYKKFLIPIDTPKELDPNSYFDMVIYEGKIYYELNFENIIRISKRIIHNLKPFYLDALAEINLELAKRVKKDEKIDFLLHIIQLFKIINQQLNIDLDIKNKHSKYYSKSSLNPDEISFEALTKKYIDSIGLIVKEQDYFDKLDELWELDYINEKSKTIGFLPASLLAISNSVIKSLDDLIFDIQSKDNDNKLQWTGKVSQLGFIISELIDNEYLEINLKHNGDINNSALARELKLIFNYKDSPASLAKYLSSDSQKYNETKNKFNKENYHLPHKNMI